MAVVLTTFPMLLVKFQTMHTQFMLTFPSILSRVTASIHIHAHSCVLQQNVVNA